MAPERATGEEPRPPVDLWSLGATLYAAVEGRPPFDGGEPMATLLSVVSEHPAPMLRAGPLEPVLRGLLTKDPAERSTAPQAARRAGLRCSPATRGQATRLHQRPPARGPAARRRRSERIEADDLRALASASKALLGSVAREARDHLVDRRREQQGRATGSVRHRAVRRTGERAAPAPRRRRFRRRWVVVPVLVTVAAVVLLLGGAVLALAAGLGLL